ncbi:ABC transporter permease [Roseomonas sp. AR75]|uniref:ABC transporter permease n=1 Tax=Roseomonas sp. AR75 TaxID=2562311 RepID=UPI001484D88B|nr:ABC transporter permease [Roseomonas sp. AR75]
MKARLEASPVLAGTLGVAILLLAWEVWARLIWRDPTTLPSPTQSVAVALGLIGPAELAAHVLTSLARILAGFTLAAIAGIAAGILCGRSDLAERTLRPILEALRPIPPLAWIPIAIIWFGLGEGSKVFVIFLGAFFPVFTAAWRGTSLVPPVLIAAARSMDVRGPALLWRIVLPAALPDIAVGLRVGFGLSFGVLVAAELIAAERGMGYLVMESRQLGQLGVAIFAIFLIGLVSLLADLQLAAIIRRTVGRWRPV